MLFSLAISNQLKLVEKERGMTVLRLDKMHNCIENKYLWVWVLNIFALFAFNQFNWQTHSKYIYY